MSYESSVLQACHAPRWWPSALPTGFKPVMLVLKAGTSLVSLTDPLSVASGVVLVREERPLLRLQRAAKPVRRACQAWLVLIFPCD